MKLHKASVFLLFFSLIVLAAVGLAAGVTPLHAPQRGSSRATGPMNENDIVRLLQAHVPPAQVGQRSRGRGIDFTLTELVEQQLEQAGADVELLQTLIEIQPQGLVWGPARRVATSDHGLLDVSDLVTEGGKHYLAFTGDDKHVRLASDAGGTWKIYDVYAGSDVGNGANRWYVSLVVHAGEVYVPYVTFTGDRNIVAVAYNSSLQGPWSQAAIYSTDSSYLNDPFGTISGDTLLVSFDSAVASGKGADDVFVASIPLASFPAGGAPFTAPLPAQVNDVTKVDDVPGGPDDNYAGIVPGTGGLEMAWQRASKTLVFAQGQTGGPGGTTWPPSPQLLATSADQAQQSLQMAAAGSTTAIARFIGNPNPTGPACCDVWATTNATGSWTTEVIGGTNLANQRPGVAVSACGPSVAFQQAISGNEGRITVATFEGGRWVNQSLAMNVVQPRLAVTPDGLDMAYQSGYGDIFFQHAKCYPPPANFHP
jgi:hypothetical protein